MIRLRLLAAVFSVLAVLAASTEPAAAWPGELDTSFGTGGLFEPAGAEVATRVVRQADGRLVVLASMPYVDNGQPDSRLYRLTANGAIDPTFGTSGTVVLPKGAFDLVLGKNDRVIASGVGGTWRFTANGTPDAFFGGGDGHVPPGGLVAEQSDGKIVLAGSGLRGADSWEGWEARPTWVLIRLNEDGTNDTGFGTNGGVETEFLTPPYSFECNISICGDGGGIEDLELSPGDKPVIISSVSDGTDSGDPNWEALRARRFALARYTTGGALDSSFGDGGIMYSGAPGYNASTLMAEPDGKLTVGGGGSPASGDPGRSSMVLVRYTTGGAVDPTFGNSGVARSPGRFTLDARDFVKDAQGRYVAIGRFGELDNDGIERRSWGLTRFSAAGAPDTTFGVNGVAAAVPATGQGNYDSFPYALAAAGNGVVGVGFRNSQAVVARFGNGEPAAPETTITSGPPATSRNPDPEIAFASSLSHSTFECQIGTGEWYPCTSPETWGLLYESNEHQRLPVGDYVFRVRASRGGFTDPTPAEHRWSVTGPETTITAGPTTETKVLKATFEFTSDSDGATFECRWTQPNPFTGGAPVTTEWDACVSPFQLPRPDPYNPTWDPGQLRDGDYRFEVRSRAGGVTDDTPAVRDFRGGTPSYCLLPSDDGTPYADDVPEEGTVRGGLASTAAISSAAAGPFVTAAGADAPVVTKAKAIFGPFVAIGCFKDLGGGVWEAGAGNTKINGIDFRPAAGSKLRLNVNQRNISSTGPVNVKVGSQELWRWGVNWTPSGSGVVPLATPENAKLAKFKGMTIEGKATLAFSRTGDDGKTTLTLGAVLPETSWSTYSYDKATGNRHDETYKGPVGEFSFVTSNKGGAVFGGIKFGIGEMTIGKRFILRNASYALNVAENTWTGKGTLVLFGDKVVTGEATRDVNGWKALSGELDGVQLPLWSGIYLQRLKMGFAVDGEDGDATPTVSGGAGFSAGPKIPDFQNPGQTFEIVSVDGQLSYTFGTRRASDVWKVEGALNMAKLPLFKKDPKTQKPVAGAWLTIQDGGTKVDFHGDLDWQAPAGAAEVNATINGWSETDKGFKAQGTGLGRVLAVRGNMQVLATRENMSGCVEALGVRMGYSFDWATRTIDPMVGKCDVGRGLKPRGLAMASATPAASEARAFSLPAGLPAAVVAVRGQTKAPAVTLTGPGVTAASGAGGGAAQTDTWAVMPWAEGKTTYVVLRQPAAGSYSIQSDDAIAELTQADGLHPVQIQASVNGPAAGRTLTWNATSLAGGTIQFVEEGAEERRILGESTAASGAMAIPPPATGGAHKIVAYVMNNGTMRDQFPVVTYDASAVDTTPPQVPPLPGGDGTPSGGDPGPAGPTPPTIDPPGAADPGPASIAITFPRGVKLLPSLKNGFVVRGRTSVAARLQATVSISKATARKLKLGKKALTVARSSGGFSAGDFSLEFKPLKRLRKKLGKARKLPLALAGVATTASGRTTAFRKTITLYR